MLFPRLTWAGLLISTLGWALLLSYPLLPHGTGTSEGGESARFMLLFGQNVIVTGLAIALLGTLEKALVLLASRPAASYSPAKPAATAPRMPAPPSPQLMTQRHANDIVTKGALAGRDYVLFRDGSVVVETLLGPRRFLSLTEAQEFIGAN
jgi:hypothetical protein